MATLRTIEFSCSIPEVTITTSAKARVVISIDSVAVFDEWLYPVGTQITLEDLSGLVTPYARKRQTVTLKIAATSESGATLSGFPVTAQVVYCQADFGEETPQNFCSNHFLSILMGPKVTAMGRKEYLHMTKNQTDSFDTVYCTAYYDTGEPVTFKDIVPDYHGSYATINVSPDLFADASKKIISYTITAGSRKQEYVIDQTQPDCAPILIFVNSFGLDELAYCTGLHKVAPSYKRNTAFFRGVQKNYKIDETRAFSADTGPLTFEMANWWDEVFRSDSVRIVNIYNGVATPGKDLLITDSKSEYTNDDAEIPRFTFTYQYAQRNHNVVQLLRAGRIFDNTFDNTFN